MKNTVFKHSVNIRIIQHVLAAFVAFVLIYAIAGTTVVINTAGTDIAYNLYESDRGRSYEESYLFNNILGNNMSNIFRHVAQRTQLETNGEYDGKKVIDITAYVQRGSVMPGDYITANYYLADLLSWSKSGFQYETKEFTAEDSRKFLSPSTTYTHLYNNMVSGGMNSYLSSQLDNNSLVFSVSGNSTPEGGVFHILVPRYKTVDGKNVENIVSTWDDYNQLNSYIEEAGNNLEVNFTEYGKLINYYTYPNSNLRYYITRTMNGNTEVYTNVEELMGDTAGIDILEGFKSFGKYIYYCPYELSYETNTLIKESVVRSVIKTYGYAYPDQIKVYLGVDTNNYSASDDFAKGKASFSKLMPNRGLLYLCCIFAVIAYFGLFTFYIVKIPVRQHEELPARRMSTEGLMFLSTFIMAVPFGAVALLMYVTKTGLDRLVRNDFFPYFGVVFVVIVNIGFLSFVYGLVRKGKDGILWEDSILKRGVAFFRDIISNTTNNGSVIVRTWIPYVFFVAMNIMLVRIGVLGIVIAGFLDILVGIYIYRQNLDREGIIHVIENIKNGDVSAKVEIEELHADNITLAEAVNSIGEGIKIAVNTSMKDEKLKADLITNVSHDIKTPLTSIINYVDLIKREDIQNERVKEYVEVLETKSQKLKQLTEDLVEASKISSGNISIQLGKIDFVELVNQTIGEFFEKFEDHLLTPIFKHEEQSMCINADARHLWRVIENLLNNVCKYALAGTRVYMDMIYITDGDRRKVEFSVKNISESELNIGVDELTERFIRGDESRTTEGSGLGLSIAKNLTIAQGGEFNIRLDGDLFKVVIVFDCIESEE
ncbi:MAG: HAMP domain-containing histidine kinase [Butyrivibrio sp.]|nr:HAMP domain-containing histidine kinase [Butyrivibrio sp.]